MAKLTKRPKRIASFFITAFSSALFYVLSSGPILATAFRLRESTHWDGLYSVMALYYPLLIKHPLTCPFCVYIEWWCWLLGAVGPG